MVYRWCVRRDFIRKVTKAYVCLTEVYDEGDYAGAEECEDLRAWNVTLSKQSTLIEVRLSSFILLLNRTDTTRKSGRWWKSACQ